MMTTLELPNAVETQTESIKIFLVDDHPVMRKGMTELLRQQKEMQIVGEASTYEEALRLIPESDANLFLIDLSLPDGDGIELIRKIRRQRPHVAILVFSMHEESIFAERAFEAGAQGYVTKAEVLEKLMEAIRQVLGGKPYLSERMAQAIAQGLSTVKISSIPKTLSEREFEVYKLIGQGYATREISQMLHLSPKTIETYRARIKEKLRLPHSSDLVRHAIRYMHTRKGS